MIPKDVSRGVNKGVFRPNSLMMTNHGAKKGASVLPSSNIKDPDAITFIDAVQDTGLVLLPEFQKQAVNTLFFCAKINGWWDLADVFYPIVGGSADSHKLNAKNPNSFSITWNGTVTHSAGGAKGNGSTGYGNLNYNPATNGVKYLQNSACLGFYSRTNVDEGTRDCGSNNATNGTIIISRSGGNSSSRVNSATASSVAITDSLGLYVANRLNSANQELWKNGKRIVNAAVASATIASQNFYIIGRNNNGTADSFTTRQYAFVIAGGGTIDQSALFEDVEYFQFLMGRNVVGG